MFRFCCYCKNKGVSNRLASRNYNVALFWRFSEFPQNLRHDFSKSTWLVTVYQFTFNNTYVTLRQSPKSLIFGISPWIGYGRSWKAYGGLTGPWLTFWYMYTLRQKCLFKCKYNGFQYNTKIAKVRLENDWNSNLANDFLVLVRRRRRLSAPSASKSNKIKEHLLNDIVFTEFVSILFMPWTVLSYLTALNLQMSWKNHRKLFNSRPWLAYV